MTLTEKDRDSVIRTVYGEARGEPDKGMIAVAWVIKNRVMDRRWPNDADSVVKQKFQFSTWNENDPNLKQIMALKATDKFYVYIKHIVDAVWSGSEMDPTNGAVYYIANTIKEPKWWNKAKEEADGKVIQIGAHKFTGKVMNGPNPVPEPKTEEPEEPVVEVKVEEVEKKEPSKPALSKRYRRRRIL